MRCADASLPLPADMRVKALKAELDERGVSWRGVAFEKDELVNLLTAAREQPVASHEEGIAANSADDEEAAFGEAYAAAYTDALKLKTKELRTELAARSVGWADLYEKEELAARLAGLVAKSALFSRSGALSPGAAAIVNGEQCAMRPKSRSWLAQALSHI